MRRADAAAKGRQANERRDADEQFPASRAGVDHGRGEEGGSRDGVSLNQFIATALAEKVSALRTEAVLTARARRADRGKFDAVMSRAGGTPPREGDEPREA